VLEFASDWFAISGCKFSFIELLSAPFAAIEHSAYGLPPDLRRSPRTNRVTASLN